MTNRHPVGAGDPERIKFLKPFTHENASERGRNGGIRSQEVQKEKKLIRKCLEILLEMKQKGSDGADISNAMAIAVAMVDKAQHGDVSAATFCRDTSGEKPTDKVDTQTTISLPPEALVKWK